MDENIILRAQNLIKKYKGATFNAVDNINLEIKRGEIYGFLGPNGAGKSTAIKMFSTMLIPTSGEVTVCGFNSVKYPSEVRQRIGIVFQNHSLDENLTAEENLRSHAILYGLTHFAPTFKTASKQYQEKVTQLLEMVQLKDRMFETIKTFSGGMKRRIDIIKALLHAPEVLFLDEPTTGLDPASRKIIWDYLVKSQKENKFTIFLTTQYLEEAEICNRISIMDHGKVLVTDTPVNLKKQVGGELIFVTTKEKEKLEELLNNKNIKYTVDEEGRHIFEGENYPLQQFIKDSHFTIDEVSLKRPTLDDVFLVLTGRDIK